MLNQKDCRKSGNPFNRKAEFIPRCIPNRVDVRFGR